MRVLKFGGTSVANAAHISKVISIVSTAAQQQKVAVVVSALGGTTDMLLEAGELAKKKQESYISVLNQISKRHQETASTLIYGPNKQSILQYLDDMLGTLKDLVQGIYLINEFSDKTKDKILSFGELMSAYIVSEALKQTEDATLKDSRTLIITNTAHTNAEVKRNKTSENIHSFFKQNTHNIVVLPGFISSNKDGETTTLGRGGSDYTAALIAAAIKASSLEIWTDVSGMYTAHPQLVKQAQAISEISYQEAMELSHFGAKVLYPPTVQPVLDCNIPIHIKNTFKPKAKGTLITDCPKTKNGLIKGISHIENIALLTLEGIGMVGIPGFSKRLFSALSRHDINVVLITQASSEHSICIGVFEHDAKHAKWLIDMAFTYEISLKKLQPLRMETGLAIVAVVGDQMKSHQGISGRMFRALGQNNVNVRAIAQGASERNISAVIAHKDIKKALNSLHNRFFEKQIKTLHLFIVGTGNVGRILLEQIQQQHDYLRSNLQLNIKVVGLSNSKTMCFDTEGIDITTWSKALKDGELRTHDKFFNTVKACNLSHSVFIDITANSAITRTYKHYLKESIAVIACNKIACASNYKHYQELKVLSRAYNAAFLFETNVGAGLPIIYTLNNLINSGDKIIAIEAVLSGSLNYIFNHFDSNHSFYEVVQQAQSEGYTEPDPRIDLSGVDVARKILILAREAGYKIDLNEIIIDSFLPRSSQNTDTIEDFYASLKFEANHFEALYQKAQAKGCQLKYVAHFNNGKASTGLKAISSNHPFYNLEGKDNIVLFYTERYKDQPLIIKGAGAGAEVTASGLFADIITLGKN